MYAYSLLMKRIFLRVIVINYRIRSLAAYRIFLIFPELTKIIRSCQNFDIYLHHFTPKGKNQTNHTLNDIIISYLYLNHEQ